jgi:hypothetical protein
VVKALQGMNIPWTYETEKIKYIIPESNHVYTVDFTFNNKILVEGKGRLSDYAERKKYELIKEQYPDIDLRFIFDNINKPCGKVKMTHGQWATKNGFQFCSVKDTDTIQQWLKESND